MIDHVNLPVTDLESSARFYEAVLKCLGLNALVKSPEVVGFGASHWEFGIVVADGDFPSMHVAFVADTRQQVHRFYDVSLQAGGQDNGAPGPRPEYGASYYAAYVLDPNGHNVEAVCRQAV